MPDKYNLGYLWNPEEVEVPEFYQPSEEELAAQQLAALVHDTYDRRESKKRQRQEARKEMLNTPVDVPATWGSATAPVFNVEIPRVGSTVGKELGTAAAYAAAPALFSPAALNFAGNMAVGLPAFEVADRLPTLIGQPRATQQAGNLLESGFRAAVPEGKLWQNFEDIVAPYVNQAGQVIGGLPVGAGAEMLTRGAAQGIMNKMARNATRNAISKAGYMEGLADMMAEGPTNPNASVRLTEEPGHIRALMEDGAFNPAEINVGPAGQAPMDIVRNADGSVVRTPDGYVVRRGVEPNGNEYYYDRAGRVYDNLQQATTRRRPRQRSGERITYDPATGEIVTAERGPGQMTPEEQQTLREQVQQRVNETLDRMNAPQAAPRRQQPIVYPARVESSDPMRARSYLRLANTLGVAPEDIHAGMDLTGIDRQALRDAAIVMNGRRGLWNAGVPEDAHFDVDAFINRLNEQVRTSARREIDEYISRIPNMSYDDLTINNIPNAWLDANYGIPEAQRTTDYFAAANTPRQSRETELFNRTSEARARLRSAANGIQNSGEQELDRIIDILSNSDRNVRNGQLMSEFGINVDDLNVGRRSGQSPVDVEGQMNSMLSEARTRRAALEQARIAAANAAPSASAFAPIGVTPTGQAPDRIGEIVDAMNSGENFDDMFRRLTPDWDELSEAFARAGIDPKDTGNPYVRATIDKIKSRYRSYPIQNVVDSYGGRFGISGHGDNSSDYLNSYIRDYTEQQAKRDLVDNFLNPDKHNSIITIKDVRDHYSDIKRQIDAAMQRMPEGADLYEYLGNTPLIQSLAEKIARRQRFYRGVTPSTDKNGAALSKYLTEKASAAIEDTAAEKNFFNANPNIRAYTNSKVDPTGEDLLKSIAEGEILDEWAAGKGLQHFNTDVLLDPFHHDYLALSEEIRNVAGGPKILPSDVRHQGWFQGREALQAQEKINAAKQSLVNPTRQQQQLYKRLEDLANAQIKLAHGFAGRQSEFLWRDIPRGGASAEANTSPESYRVQIATAKRNWGRNPGQITLLDTGLTTNGNNLQNDRFKIVPKNGKYVLEMGKPEVYRNLVGKGKDAKWVDLVDQEGVNNLVSRTRNGEDLFSIINSDPQAKKTVEQLLEALQRQKQGTFTGTNLSLKQINAKHGESLRLIPDQSYTLPGNVTEESSYSSELLRDLTRLLEGKDVAPHMRRPYFITVKHKYGGLINRLNSFYGGDAERIKGAIVKACGGKIFAGGGYVPSEDIKNYIKKQEAFRDKWYKDGNGIDTVGYGFTGKNVAKLYPNGMTKKEADDYFENLVGRFAKRMEQLTPNIDRLTQNQKDALFSYFYNIGEGNYSTGSPKMQQALRDFDLKAVMQNIDAGYNDKKNPGLKKRRDYERELFGKDIQHNAQPIVQEESTGMLYMPEIQRFNAQVPMAGGNMETVRPLLYDYRSGRNPFGALPERSIVAYSNPAPTPEYELPEINVTPDIQKNTRPRLYDTLVPSIVRDLMSDLEVGGLLADYRSGGKIHIKPENRGKFTALLKRTGKSASWYKAHGTPLQRKRATFALNARKWKHADGGLIDRIDSYSGGDAARALELIQKARKG